MARSRLGGYFPPPITQELLDAYKAIAAKTTGQIKDAFDTLLACFETWWELDYSQSFPSNSKIPITSVIDIDPDKMAALDAKIPWQNEIDALIEFIETIDQKPAERNRVKFEAWYASVRSSILATHFPEPGLFEKVAAGERDRTWMDLLTKEEHARIEGLFNTFAECNAEIAVAFRDKFYKGIPRPVVEPTPVRDAAHHLLWYMRELNMDREPVTMEMI